MGNFNAFFCDFRLRRIFEQRIAPKSSLGIDQDKKNRKFSALHVDFNSLRFDPHVQVVLRTGRQRWAPPSKRVNIIARRTLIREMTALMLSRVS